MEKSSTLSGRTLVRPNRPKLYIVASLRGLPISNTILKWEIGFKMQNANAYCMFMFTIWCSSQDCRLVSTLFITKCLHAVRVDVVLYNSKVGVVI